MPTPTGRPPLPTRSNRAHAEKDAERVHRRAVWSRLLRALRGLPTHVLPFDAMRALRPRNESYRGVQAIEIDRIVGSVDRYQDFTPGFDPRPELPLDRWIGIRTARLDGTELPAIEVFQVGEIYFVKDGHHRVAVARDAGQRYIDAEIVELRVPVPPEMHDTPDDLARKAAYAAFLDASDLPTVVPDYQPVRLTDPERYATLLQHIEGHGWLRGLRQRREIPFAEAVASWYRCVYAPLVAAIRDGGLMDAFPGRSDGDLYLWVTDHRWFLTERSGEAVSAEVAAADYARAYAPSRLRRLWERARLAAGTTWRGRTSAR